MRSRCHHESIETISNEEKTIYRISFGLKPLWITKPFHTRHSSLFKAYIVLLTLFPSICERGNTSKDCLTLQTSPQDFLKFLRFAIQDDDTKQFGSAIYNYKNRYIHYYFCFLVNNVHFLNSLIFSKHFFPEVRHSESSNT